MRNIYVINSYVNIEYFYYYFFFLIVPKYHFMFYKSMIGNYMRWLMYKIMWGVEGIQL